MVRIHQPGFRVCPCGFGNVWAKNRRASYCSKRCANRYWWRSMRDEFPIPKPQTTCPTCKRAFSKALKTQAYCSPRCRELAHGDRRRRATARPKDGVTRCCETCGLEFVSRRWNQVFCSKPCKEHVVNKSYRDRKRGHEHQRDQAPSRSLIQRRMRAIQQQRQRNGAAKGQTEQQPQRAEVSALASRNPDCLREDSKGMA